MKPEFEIKQLSDKYDYLAPDGSEIRLLAKVNAGGFCHCTLPADKTSSAVKHKTVEEICLSLLQFPLLYGSIIYRLPIFLETLFSCWLYLPVSPTRSYGREYFKK